MIKKVTSLFLILLVLMLNSCKDDTPVKASKEVQPNQLSTFITFSLFNTTKTGIGTYEYGCVFSPKVNGSITALSCLMPDIDIYPVTLYDSATQTVLATENIANNDTIFINSKNINPIKVIAGKSYVLTIKSVNKRWFNFTRIGGGNIPYPLQNNYMQLKGYLWVSTSLVQGPKFPINSDKTYIAGLADFSFQPD